MKYLIVLSSLVFGFNLQAWDYRDCARTAAETGFYMVSQPAPEGTEAVLFCQNDEGGLYCEDNCQWSVTDNEPQGPPNGPINSGGACGSIIHTDQLAVGESAPVSGTTDKLNYFTDRSAARTSEYTFHMPVTGGTVDSDIASIEIDLTIAGKSYTQTFSSPAANIGFDFTWDGKDSSGQSLIGSALATIAFHTLYTSTAGDFPAQYSARLGSFKAIQIGLGGLTISSVHFYDPVAKKIYYGSGESKDSLPPIQVNLDANGHITDVTGSSSFNYYMVVNASAKEAYLFNADGRHVQTRSTVSGALLKTVTYDGAGQISSISDSFNNVLAFTRSTGNVTITAPFGQTTSIALDTFGRAISITDALNHVRYFTYDSAGLMDSFKNPAGAISSFTYDGNGLLTNDSHSAGASLSFLKSTSFSWPNTASTLTETTNLGRVTSIMSYANQTSYSHYESLPSGTSPSFSLTPGSNNSTVSSTGRNISTSVSPDQRFPSQSFYDNQVTIYAGSQTSQANISISSSTPSSGTDLLNLTSENETRTVDSNTWTRAYDGTTGISTTTSPVGRITKITTNAKNQITQTQKANFHTIDYTYDAQGRLSHVTQGTRDTQFTYNPAGFLQQKQDPLGKITQFSYDANGNTLSQTLPDNRVLNYTYDVNGNLATIQTPSSVTHNFNFNLYNLIANYTAPSISASNYNTVFQYNNDKQLTLITRPDSSTVQMSYDATTGLLTKSTTSEGDYTLTYTGELLSQITNPQAVTNSFTYDGDLTSNAQTQWSGVNASVAYTRSNLLISSLTLTDTGSHTGVVNFTYDNDRLITAAGNMTLTRDTNSGFVTQTTLGNVKESLTYDSSFGELASYTAAYSGTQIYKEVYTRDPNGRISTKAVTDGSITTTFGYTYDDAARLSKVYVNSVLTRTYNYDGNSNRTSFVSGNTTTNGSYDNQDRLLSYGAYSFTSNLNGERTGRSQSGSIETFAYGRDQLGNIKQVTHRYLSGSTTVTDNFSYLNDALGRRVEIKKGTAVQHRYLYDESDRIIAELNSTGQTVSQFVYASTSFAPDYMIKSGVKYKFIHDSNGSVIKVINSSNGSVASSLTYDEFGNVTASVTPDFQPFGFAGGLRDSITNLTRFGARDYDPMTGRWLSKDPILFNGGDTNLYGYALQDPVNLIDPSGMASSMPSTNYPGPAPDIPPDMQPNQCPASGSGGSHGPPTDTHAPQITPAPPPFFPPWMPNPYNRPAYPRLANAAPGAH